MGFIEFFIIKIKKFYKKREIIIGKNTIRNVIYIQIPKLFFTGLLCIVIWKINEEVSSLKEETLKSYTSSTIRKDRVDADYREFEKILNMSEEIDKEIDNQIAVSINNTDNDMTPKEIILKNLNKMERENKQKHEINEYSNDELKILNEFEEWAKEMSEKQNKYEKKYKI